METVQDAIRPSGVRSALRASLFLGAAIVVLIVVAGALYLPPLLATYGAYYLGALLVTAMLVALAPRLWKASANTGQKRVRLAFQLQAVLSGAVALVALMFVACPLEFRSGTLFEILVVAIPSLAFAVPAGMLAVAYLLKDQSDASLFRDNPAVQTTRLLVSASWVGSVLLVALAIWIQSRFS